MRNPNLISLTLVLSAGAFIACGGGASGVSSGVDQSKPADEVTDDEAERICEATADYYESRVNDAEVGCRLQGLLAAVATAFTGGDDDELQDACQGAYDGCLEDAPEPEEADCSDADADAAMCDDSVTVGEVETCLTDTVDAGADAADEMPSCSEVTIDELERIGEMLGEGVPVVEQPASCEDVVEACPGLSALGG